jgi:dipeptidyl aminopeptidase/acylaminoacyl peptidase
VTDASPTPFHDLAAFTALPRCAGLVLSPDGTRLVTGVTTPDVDGTCYRTALWEIDPTGARPARRLTRGDPGEHDAAFTPAGDLLFLSARTAPGETDDDPPPALWTLPAGGGEALLVGTRPGGLGGPVVARDAGTVVCTSATLPGAVTADDDAARRAARKDAKVTAILHEGTPVRFWDHDLGPARPRLLAASPSPTEPAADEPMGWTDLTPTPGGALDQVEYDVTPDGSTVVTTWRIDEPGGESRHALVALHVTAPREERRVLLDDPAHTVDGPVVSPDGGWVACRRTRRTTATEPPDTRCVVVPVDGGDARDVAPGWDRWVTAFAWTPDSAALVVTADDGGRAPLFRVDLAGGTVARLTDDHGAYSEPVVGPDGAVYALRSAVDAPPAPVRIDHGGVPVPLPPPTPAPALPGSLTEMTAVADDGTPLRAWLVLPDGVSATTPAPLLLWIHGGPLNSWNAWHWRWNPWIMAAHGYAVLLPDPALSTGYGRVFVARGWGRWGAEPYTDLLALTDAAERLPEIDGARTAAMGGSFGGYMANWMAGHTDRFAAIVTHASLWALDQFVPTTDLPAYWLRELTPQVQAQHSPHRHADAITTPMLVIHGDRDHRVPIGEALRLWADLVGRCSDRVPHKFLYFPDENHWVLRPSHARLWYATVLAFLAHHLDRADWVVPDLLR